MTFDGPWVLSSWIDTNGAVVITSILSMLGLYVALVLYTRLAGLRSFSKMSSFDFAITVAFGTVLASTMLAEKPPLVQAVLCLGALYLLQFLISWLRQRVDSFASVVDNEPILLMAGEQIIHENLKRARVTEADVRGKLREANVTRYDQIEAVIMESTGDVSVMHADPDGPSLDPALLSGVRGAEHFRKERSANGSS